jgi:protein TonB
LFEHTFLEAPRRGERPHTLLLSLLLQSAAVCVLILLPLYYTGALPEAVLRSLIVAPAVPRAASPEPMAPKIQTKFVAREFRLPLLTALSIPEKAHPAAQASLAPDIGVEGGSPQGNGIGVPGIDLAGSAPDAPVPPPQTPPKERPHSGPVRIGSMLGANLIHKVMPVYPPLAKSTHVQGIVEFTALISKEGKIENIQLVRGHPLLVPAATEAVLQWRYRPTLLNGVPVEVITDIIVNFTLNQ